MKLNEYVEKADNCLRKSNITFKILKEFCKDREFNEEDFDRLEFIATHSIDKLLECDSKGVSEVYCECINELTDGKHQPTPINFENLKDVDFGIKSISVETVQNVSSRMRTFNVKSTRVIE